jgi:hypothetical protein
MITRIKNIPTPFAAMSHNLIKFFRCETSCDDFLTNNPTWSKVVQDVNGDLILYSEPQP